MRIKKIFFMLDKIYTDLTVDPVPFNITDDFHSPILGEYYLLFKEDPAKLNVLIKDFDENGIPLNSAYVDVNTTELHYYPISIGQFGLALFNSYIQTNSDEKKDHFLRIAEWFYENRIESKDLGAYWLTDIPKPEYKVFDPWKSAFTQSRAISILLRAWQVTNDDKYFTIAKAALIPFQKKISEGGVSVDTDNGIFFEEYVAEQPTMVLDGHVFSLFGLYDFYRAVEKENNYSAKAKELFDSGVESLVKWLPKYDMGFWLRFNMCKMEHYPEVDPCTIGYLNLITIQMKVLYKITGLEIFDNYSKKFRNYNSFTNKIRMYPIKYKALKKLGRV